MTAPQDDHYTHTDHDNYYNHWTRCGYSMVDSNPVERVIRQKLHEDFNAIFNLFPAVMDCHGPNRNKCNKPVQIGFIIDVGDDSLTSFYMCPEHAVKYLKNTAEALEQSIKEHTRMDSSHSPGLN